MPLPLTNLEHILDHTRLLWEELRGQRLYLTGGTGFFGRWLAESFLHANDRLNLGASLHLLTRSAEAFRKKAPHITEHPAVVLQQGEQTTFDFPAGEFSHIIHAAVETNPPSTRGPLDLFLCNLEGTRRMLDFAVAAKTKRFLYASSGAVYGRQPSDLTHTPEDYRGAPDTLSVNSSYAEHKRAGEYLCSAYANQYGFDALLPRCFAFAGPLLPLDLGFAIGNFVRDALSGGPLKIGGDGMPYRSYLYAADLAIWLWTILFKGESCRAYNVGSDHAVTIAELARTVAAELCPGAEVQIARQPDPAKPAERYVPDVDRARKELGLDVWVPLDEAIRRMALFAQQGNA